jgi:hypothetical protein
MIACGAGVGAMNRTKWMRLAVRDLGDVIRWAGAQNAREIGEFRYRVVNGREMVSFRLVPRYAIDIGAREIIVLAYAQIIGWRARMGNLRRIAVAAVQRAKRQLSLVAVTPPPAASLPPHRIALLRPFSAASQPARPSS